MAHVHTGTFGHARLGTHIGVHGLFCQIIMHLWFIWHLWLFCDPTLVTSKHSKPIMYHNLQLEENGSSSSLFLGRDTYSLRRVSIKTPYLGFSENCFFFGTMELAEISGAAVAKLLASCKQSSRNRAVSFLCSWLPHQNGGASTIGVSDLELIKIWKGLFFCVWHSDKLPNQVELINRLTVLLSSLPPELACRYFESFLTTIRREWCGIDFLRLDKFYLLIRRFLRHVFIFLKNHSWNIDLTSRMIGALSQGSLLSVDNFPAAGVNYHIAEIFLDEIAEFLPLTKEILDLVLNPFISIMQNTTDRVLVNKIKVNIFDRLALNGSNLLNDVGAGGDIEVLGKIALAMRFSKRFFDMASAAETLQGNRKVLFGLHDVFLKLDKELEKSGLDVSLKKQDNGSSVPKSICNIETTMFSSSDLCGDINEEFDNALIKKKKKKKKKKSLECSIEGNGIDPGKKRKSKKHKMKQAELSTECISAEATISNSGAIANIKNGNLNSSYTKDMVSIDDSLLSNLQKQFEKVAAEAGMDSGINAKVSKKLKRAKYTENKQNFVMSENGDGKNEAGRSTEMSVKKVRFSMNKNLIWKPQNPLPPQSLRLPPSVTPRGSALKKGLSPGPIRESPPTLKKIKARGSSVKRGRKTLKTVSSAVKHFRMLEGFSA